MKFCFEMTLNSVLNIKGRCLSIITLQAHNVWEPTGGSLWTFYLFRAQELEIFICFRESIYIFFHEMRTHFGNGCGLLI